MMLFPNPKSLAIQALVMVFLVLPSVSCRKEKRPERISINKLEVVLAPELATNRLGDLSGPVYEAYANSPIHWQPWGPEVLQRAEESKRLVFCVIGLPQYLNFSAVMRDLEGSDDVVNSINSNYVPVLIDADVAREYALLSVELSSEVARTISFPLFLWLDYRGHPVACTPTTLSQPGGVRQVFKQSHSMIAPMWENDLERWLADGSEGYVLNNSAQDHAGREKRIEARIAERTYSEDTLKDTLAALRQLQSHYDSYAKGFVNVGGVHQTATAIELLSEASMRESVPAGLRQRSREIVAAAAMNLVSSPMVDPLDGGVFSGRAARTWQLPAFVKDCTVQAHFAAALMSAYQSTGEQRFRQVAEGVFSYAEQHCRASEGGFALAAVADSDPSKWMWSTEEVADILGGDQLGWWAEMTGMKELGNLPLEDDPTRNLFRKNALAQVKSDAEMAKVLGISGPDFDKRREEASKKLLAARKIRLRSGHEDRSPHLVASFSMVSSYITAYRATGEADYLTKARELFAFCRSHFFRDGQLVPFGRVYPASFGSARSYHHVMALRAVLDLCKVANDDEAMAWADLLMARLAEDYLKEGVLLECAEEANLTGLRLEDDHMTFEASSLGRLSQVAVAMAAAGHPVPEDLRKVLGRLPVKAKSQPVDYTDLLMALLDRHFPMTTAVER